MRGYVGVRRGCAQRPFPEDRALAARRRRRRDVGSAVDESRGRRASLHYGRVCFSGIEPAHRDTWQDRYDRFRSAHRRRATRSHDRRHRRPAEARGRRPARRADVTRQCNGAVLRLDARNGRRRRHRCVEGHAPRRGCVSVSSSQRPRADAGPSRVASSAPSSRRSCFAGATPWARTARLGDERFRVIGIRPPRGTNLGMNLDEVVIVPLGRHMRCSTALRFSRASSDVTSHDALPAVRRSVIEVIKARHDDEEDVTVIDAGLAVGNVLAAVRRCSRRRSPASRRFRCRLRESAS